MPQNPPQVYVGLLNGKPIPIQSAPDGSLLESRSLPPLYNAALINTLWGAANQTPVTTSVGLATTYTGLCLSNPANSGKNLILIHASSAFSVAPAALLTIGLIVGYAPAGITVHTTPVAEGSNIIGTPIVNVGNVDSACTLVGTPTWRRWFAQTVATGDSIGFEYDFQGSLILPPGAYAAIGTTVAGPATGFYGSVSWMERPIAG